MAWDVTENKVLIKVAGSTVELPPVDVTSEKIIRIAKEQGLSRFTVKVDGTEVSSPSEFQELKGGEVVEIVPYDEWGV